MKLIITTVFILLFSGEAYSQTNNNPKVAPVHTGAFSSTNLTYVVGKIYVLAPPPSGKQAEAKEEIASNIKVYPNPVTNILHIETLQKSEVKFIAIADMSGKVMYTGKLENNQIDVSFLKLGAYTIKFDHDKTKTFKIIKN